MPGPVDTNRKKPLTKPPGKGVFEVVRGRNIFFWRGLPLKGKKNLENRGKRGP